MSLPNFLIFGTARSGTTALHEYLGQHPHVFMSEPKEPHFLAFEGKTVDFKGPGDDRSMNKNTLTTFEEYRRLFPENGKYRAVGEASIAYLYYGHNTIAGIKRNVPDARLICMLRQPAERAYSAYGLQRSRMLEPFRDFERALGEEDRRVAAGWHHIWHYRRMGYYAAQLRPYFDAFPRSQIRVYLYDEFLADRMAVIHDCLDFIGVDRSMFVLGRTPQTVLAGEPKSRLLQAALMRAWRFKSAFSRVVPSAIRKPVWRKLNKHNLKRERLDPRCKAELTSEYREDIRELGELLQRDLSMWLSA